MTTEEAARYQWKQLRGKPFGVKVRHILTYYRLPALIVLLLMLIAAGMLWSSRQEEQTLISVYCLNAQRQSESRLLEQSIAQRLGGETAQGEVHIFCAPYLPEGQMEDTALMQTFVTHLLAGEVDAVAGDTEAMSHLAANGGFCSLQEVLDPQSLDALGPDLLYIDQAAVDRAFYGEDGDVSGIRLGPPEGMEEPVPVAIRVSRDSGLCSAFQFREEGAVLGIPAFSQRKSAAAEFLKMSAEP